jgi:hypothetical protein
LGAGGTRLVRAGARRVALVGTAVGVHVDRVGPRLSQLSWMNSVCRRLRLHEAGSQLTTLGILCKEEEKGAVEGVL